MSTRFKQLLRTTGRIHHQKAIYTPSAFIKTQRFSSLNNESEPKEHDWRQPAAFTLSVYKDLSKLSALVVLTTMAGYSMAPGSISLVQLLFTTLGTGLCVGSANTFNQWIESAYDAQMARTSERAIVTRVISPPHAFFAGTVLATSGVVVLYTLVNPLVAVIGLLTHTRLITQGGLNIIIYTLVYTPLKRISTANTWAGAVVGALPPAMGWVAATGSIDPGAVILGLTLYAWQFPHFNALSWNLRPDYAKAGYRMMSVANEQLNARVALRHACFLFPLCFASTYIQLTTPLFLLDSSLLNLCLLIPAVQFWRESNERTARRLFFASLIHLPVLLALFMIHKQHVKKETDRKVPKDVIE